MSGLKFFNKKRLTREEEFSCFFVLSTIQIRNKKGTLTNLDIFEHNWHDCSYGEYAIECFTDDGPIFGFDDIVICDKWDQHFFAFIYMF